MTGEEVFPRNRLLSRKLDKLDFESVVLLIESGLDELDVEIPNFGPGARVRIVASDQGVDGRGIFTIHGFVHDGPAQESIFAGSGFGSGSIGGFVVVLGCGGESASWRSGSQLGEILSQELDTGLGKFVRQSTIIVVYININFRLINNWSMVQLLIHDHQSDTGFGRLVFDRFADTKGAPILGEKGEMEIEGANGGGREPFAWNDLAVADDQEKIRSEELKVGEVGTI